MDRLLISSTSQCLLTFFDDKREMAIFIIKHSGCTFAHDNIDDFSQRMLIKRTFQYFEENSMTSELQQLALGLVDIDTRELYENHSMRSMKIEDAKNAQDELRNTLMKLYIR